jgi:hypothetical protein
MQLLELVGQSHQLSDLKLGSGFKILTFSEIMAAGSLTMPTGLKRLDVSRRQDVDDIRPLGSCTALQFLNLARCYEVEDLTALASCTALQLLNLMLQQDEGFNSLGFLHCFAALGPHWVQQCGGSDGLGFLHCLAALEPQLLHQG